MYQYHLYLTVCSKQPAHSHAKRKMVVGKDTGKEAVVEPEVIYKEEIVEKFVDKIIEVIVYLPHKLSCKVHSSRQP